MQGLNLTNRTVKTLKPGTHRPSHRLSAVWPSIDARRDLQVRRRRALPRLRRQGSAAAAATADADLPRRIGGPGNGDLSSSAATAATAAASAERGN